MQSFENKRTLQLWAGILIGLLAVGTLFYFNLEQVRFVYDKEGTHCWTDQNQNGVADLQNSQEFYPCSKGEYRKEEFADALLSINWSKNSLFFLVSALLFMGLRDLFYIIRIRFLSDKQLTWRSSFHTIMLWEFASALSPGVMSGAAVAMFILHREKVPLGKSTAMVMVTAMLDNLFFTVMIPIVFLLYGGSLLFPEKSGLESIFWVGYSLFFLVFAFFFSALFLFPGLVPTLLRVIVRLPFVNRWKESVTKTASDIRLTAIEIRSFNWRLWLQLIGSTFGSWISRFLVINCLLAAFIKLEFLQHLLILSKQLILWLFMRMSPTPGGSGVAEYVFGELMSPLGGSVVLTLGLALVWRILSYYSYLIIGSVILPRWLKKKETIQRSN
jgi:uncharacterized protein (TIRG00374 family)